MAKKRYPGTNVLVEWDPTGGTTFQEITLIRNVQLPGDVRSRIDMTALKDTEAFVINGIPQESNFSFQEVFDGNDASSTALKSAYDTQTQANWQVTFTDGSAQTLIATFLGKVAELSPTQADDTNGLFRDVVVTRQGPTAYTQGT